MLWNPNVLGLFAQAAQAAAPETAEGDSSVLLNLLLAIAVVVGSFVAGPMIARWLRMREYGFKIGLVLFTLVASLAVNIAGWPPKRGIDLSGGVVLIYEVDKSATSPALVEETTNEINQRLAETDSALKARPSGTNQFEIDVPEGEDVSQVERQVSALNMNLREGGRRSEGGKTVLVYNFNPRNQRTVDMDKLIAAVGKRINPSGVKELTIRRYGADQVEVIVPEVDVREVEQIKRKISTSGLLEFRIVANPIDDKELIKAADKTPGRDVYIGGQLAGRWVQAGPDLNVPGKYRETPNRGREILVRIDRHNVDGRYLTQASQGIGDTGLAVNFSFDAEGAQKFGRLTGANLPDEATGFKRELGIILDNVMLSAPTINSVIHGNGQITGRFTKEDIDFLVGVLNAGSLPASLSPEPISQQRISSQLGDDTIRKGAMAILVSTVAILVFMAVYYRFCGVVADIAVMLNMIVTVALMILIKAAFTLPGLAGLVLTVGMAVDANVLIYERMREETERGASLRMAIRNGYARAMATIIDSHVTTLVSAAVLYMVGSDQIKGFAVTLIIGLLMSLFTAVYVSRVLFDIAERKGWLTRLNMMHVIGHTNIDFIRLRGPAIAASVLICAVGAVATVMRGSELLDIDFTGGSSVQVVFSDKHDIADVRAAVQELPDVAVSAVGEQQLEYKVDTSEPEIAKVQELLQQKFGDALLTYHMSFGPLVTIEAKPAAENKPEGTPAGASGASETPAGTPAEDKTKEEAPQPQTPAEPAANPPADKPDDKTESPQASRGDLPKGLALASSDPASALTLIVGQDAAAKSEPASETAAKAETSPAQPPAEQPATKQSATASGDTPESADAEAKAASNRAAAESGDPAATNPEGAAMVGGTRVTLSFPQEISYTPLREMVDRELKELNLKDAAYELSNPDYKMGSEARYKDWTLETTLQSEQTQQLLNLIQQRMASTPVFPSSNQIGGKVAGDTQMMALYALLASMFMIVVYIWIRFQNVIFGVAAVVALVHDVAITVAFLAMSYYLSPYLGFLQVDPFKISLAVLAALLTIVGFSINDTIVVFDRIREVRGKSPDLTENTINLSVNQTLSRTLLTSGTVFIASIILYFMGGPGIHGFAFSMVVGVIAGTYSSIYIAAPILLWMNKSPDTQNSQRPRRTTPAGTASKTV
ncbi:MAG TPA: protein translocase subunit SecD [Pirellulales bacterium]|jgi:SecD/SecF fusion protein|nr:protein translocase subunit SecD [Pirellulales bacterium]